MTPDVYTDLLKLISDLETLELAYNDKENNPSNNETEELIASIPASKDLKTSADVFEELERLYRDRDYLDGIYNEH